MASIGKRALELVAILWAIHIRATTHGELIQALERVVLARAFFNGVLMVGQLLNGEDEFLSIT